THKVDAKWSALRVVRKGCTPRPAAGVNMGDKQAASRGANQQPVVEVFEIGELLSTLRAFRRGNFSTRIGLHYTGAGGEAADLLNSCIEQNEARTRELA